VIQTLELITGTLYVTDPAIKLSEIRLTQSFLRNLRGIVDEKKREEIDRNLTKNEFDRVVMEMLSKSVNLTLNEVDQIDEHTSLLLHNTYNELSRSETTLENYTKRVEEKRSDENKANDATNKKACEVYYYFALTTLTDLIYDIDLFNQRSTSLLSKIGVILSKRGESLQNYFKKIYANMGSLLSGVKENLRTEKLKEFYANYYEKMSNLSSSSLQAVKTKVDSYKEWVGSNKYVQNALHYPNIFYEKASSYSSSSRVYVYDHIYSPCKNVTVTVTSDSYNFVLRNVENAKETSKKIYESVKENVGKNTAI